MLLLFVCFWGGGGGGASLIKLWMDSKQIGTDFFHLHKVQGAFLSIESISMSAS